MNIKPIMDTAIGLESLAVMKRSSKLVTKPTPKKLLKGMLDVSVGTALMIPTSKMVNDLA